MFVRRRKTLGAVVTIVAVAVAGTAAYAYWTAGGSGSGSGTAGSTVISLGNGSDTVSIAGSKNTITVGNGTNVIDAGTNGAVVHTGSGGATVTVGGQTNLVDVGAGTNTINAGSGSRLDTFVLNGNNQGLTTITGFAVNTGNVLDLTRTLSGMNIAGDLSNLGNYIIATTSNGSTTLSVDPTGGSGVSTHYAFASLQGITTSVSALVAAQDIKVG